MRINYYKGRAIGCSRGRIHTYVSNQKKLIRYKKVLLLHNRISSVKTISKLSKVNNPIWDNPFKPISLNNGSYNKFTSFSFITQRLHSRIRIRPMNIKGLDLDKRERKIKMMDM